MELEHGLRAMTRVFGRIPEPGERVRVVNDDGPYSVEVYYGLMRDDRGDWYAVVTDCSLGITGVLKQIHLSLLRPND